MSTTSKQNFNAILIGIIVLLLAGVAYLWYENSNLKKTSATQKDDIVEMQKVQAELDADYQSALETLEEMRGENAQLNSLIDTQKGELKAQKDRINVLIRDKKDLDKARLEIKNLNVSVAKYLADIDQLKAENKILTESNVQLSSKLEQEASEKSAIIQEKQAISSEKDKLSKSNEVLGSQVDMANAIKVNFLQVKGYELNDKGKLKEKSKAKDINMIRICFTTETNMVTPKGAKTFYIRYINPQGETVALESEGSGVLKNKLDNSQVRYTTSATVDYNNEDTNACADWALANKMEKGEYKVELYNNGFLVGKGQFSMK